MKRQTVFFEIEMSVPVEDSTGEGFEVLESQIEAIEDKVRELFPDAKHVCAGVA